NLGLRREDDAESDRLDRHGSRLRSRRRSSGRFRRCPVCQRGSSGSQCLIKSRVNGQGEGCGGGILRFGSRRQRNTRRFRRLGKTLVYQGVDRRLLVGCIQLGNRAAQRKRRGAEQREQSQNKRGNQRDGWSLSHGNPLQDKTQETLWRKCAAFTTEEWR